MPLWSRAELGECCKSTQLHHTYPDFEKIFFNCESLTAQSSNWPGALILERIVEVSVGSIWKFIWIRTKWTANSIRNNNCNHAIFLTYFFCDFAPNHLIHPLFSKFSECDLNPYYVWKKCFYDSSMTQMWLYMKTNWGGDCFYRVRRAETVLLQKQANCIYRNL